MGLRQFRLGERRGPQRWVFTKWVERPRPGVVFIRPENQLDSFGSRRAPLLGESYILCGRVPWLWRRSWPKCAAVQSHCTITMGVWRAAAADWPGIVRNDGEHLCGAFLSHWRSFGHIHCGIVPAEGDARDADLGRGREGGVNLGLYVTLSQSILLGEAQL